MWNHRLVQINHGLDMEPWVEIKETFYNPDGSIMGFSDACLGTEYPGQMVALLQRMIDDITRNPDVLTLDAAVGPKTEEAAF
jgi:hypothetical protein